VRNGTEPTSGHRVQRTSSRSAGTAIDRTLVGDADERIAEQPDTHFDAVLCNEKHLSRW
jgi:hypothetical protein